MCLCLSTANLHLVLDASQYERTNLWGISQSGCGVQEELFSSTLTFHQLHTHRHALLQPVDCPVVSDVPWSA